MNFNNYDDLKYYIWSLQTQNGKKSLVNIIYDSFIYGIIILNTILAGLNSFSLFYSNSTFEGFYKVFVTFSIFVLLIDYILQLWSCVVDNRYSHPIKGRIKYLFSFLSILYLIVFIAFFTLGYKYNLIFLLLFRIFDLAKYIGEEDEYSPINILKKTFTNKKEELIITIIVVLIFLFLGAYLMYYIERPFQPEKLSNIMPSLGWVFGLFLNADFVDFHPVTIIGKVIYVLLIILGVIAVGLPVGILTGSFIEEIENSKKYKDLKTKRDMLIEAFDFEQELRIRKLVKSLELKSERKFLNVQFAMTRLELSEDDIFDACNFADNLRIRAVRRTYDSKYPDTFVIEYYIKNTSFGAFINRNSNIHIISHQNAGEFALGHFTRQIAYAINANYYSNELYSSANLRRDIRLNFAINKKYNGPKEEMPPPLREFVDILDNNIKEGDLVISFGVSDSVRKPGYHILFGGEEGNFIRDVKNPTVNNLDAIENFYNYMSEKMQEFDLEVVTHNEFSNTNKNHITQVIRNKYKANVVTIFVKRKILHFASNESYYKQIRILADAIKKLSEEVNG